MFLRARYYDTATGRFVGRDKLEFAQRYAQAGNNPALLIDPSGNCFTPSTKRYCPFERMWNTAADEIRSLPRVVTDLCGDDEAVGGATFHYECGGPASWYLQFASLLQGDTYVAFTLGDDIYSDRSRLDRGTMVHEGCHVGQFGREGMPGFLLKYFGALPRGYDKNPFEQEAERARAGFQPGGDVGAGVAGAVSQCRAGLSE